MSESPFSVQLNLKYSTRQSAGDIREYMINYVPYRDRLIGIYRRDKGCSQGGTGVYIIEFSPSNGFLKKEKDEKISDIECEDPRVFLYHNRPHALFWGAGHSAHGKKFYLMDIVRRKISLINPKGIERTGKNWSALVMDNDLYIVYRPHPFVLYKYEKSDHTLTLKREIKYEGEHVRGGTSFIEHAGAWYGVAHKTHSPHYHTAWLVRVSSDFTSVTQRELLPSLPLYRKGVLDPLGIFTDKTSSELVFVCNWAPQFVWNSSEFHTVEGRIPLSQLSLICK